MESKGGEALLFKPSYIRSYAQKSYLLESRFMWLLKLK